MLSARKNESRVEEDSIYNNKFYDHKHILVDTLQLSCGYTEVNLYIYIKLVYNKNITFITLQNIPDGSFLSYINFVDELSIFGFIQYQFFFEI